MIEYNLSERRACRLIGMSRSQFRYKANKLEDPRVIAEIIRIKRRHKRFGVRRVSALLREKNLIVNAKRVHRLMKVLKLLVKRKIPSKRPLFIAPTKSYPNPSRTHQCWAMDFVSAKLSTGATFRCFTIVDIYSRLCPEIFVSVSMKHHLPLKILEKLRLQGLKPESIILDNGPEFKNYAFDLWSKEHDVSLHFIDPGEPVQNAYIESFNGKFRDECLNERAFGSIADAKHFIKKWLVHYNEDRPHSSLDYLTPKTFAEIESNKYKINNAPRKVVLKLG